MTMESEKSSTSTAANPAGWYPDPEGWDRLRYFDGAKWTNHFHQDGAPSNNPNALKGRGTAPGQGNESPEQLRAKSDALWAARQSTKRRPNPLAAWFDSTFTNCVNFSGRTRRSVYWYTVLVDVIILGVLGYLAFNDVGFDDTISISPLDERVPPVPFYALVIYGFVLFVSRLALSVRRLHDIGKSGAWLLIELIPFGGLVLFAFWMFDGDTFRNRYGNSPKYRIAR